ncbi:MAG TPA: hypothetical protein DCL54_03220 [Alphaproteobacteria bacterium]|nr:hypothetical protein [Alphaproteobacteria bacterium]
MGSSVRGPLSCAGQQTITVLRPLIKAHRTQVLDPVAIFIPTLTAGGAERVASILANQWCQSHQVKLITYFNEAHFYTLDPRVEVLSLGYVPNRRQPGRTVDVALALAAFRRKVLKIRPRFVLSFMNKYNAFALASLWGSGTPVIVSERDSPTEVLPRLRVLARDSLYPGAAGAIFQTAAAQAFHLGRSRIARSTIIPNPITRIIEPSERTPEKIVLSVGRLVGKKAVDHLIRAFGAMQTPGWRLMICGDGPMRATLDAQVSSLGLSSRVDFIGAVSDLRPFYKRAGMFAFSSLYEGFPNALAEAMVSGLPCVSYDCPTGPSELIQDRVNGRLVPVGDWISLAAAMDEVAAEQVTADRYGEASATLARALDPQTIADRFLEFCDQSAQKARQ